MHSQIGQAAPAPFDVKRVTYIGGSGLDTPTAMTTDTAGNIYVVGSTTSADFPTTPRTFQPIHAVGVPGNQDAFVAKLDPTGTKLLWSTYLGGDQDDAASAIGLDSQGNVFVAGLTNSTSFPAFNGVSNPQHTEQTFIAKLSADGSALLYVAFASSHPVGGHSVLAIDRAGSAYLATADSYGDITATPGALSIESGNQFNVVLVEQYSPSGQLGWIASIATFGYPPNLTIVADPLGAVDILGTGGGTTLVSPDAYQEAPANPGSSSFLVRCDSTGTQLLYGTYFGPQYDTTGINTAFVDNSGAVYFAGDSNAPNLPVTPGAFLQQAPPLVSSNPVPGYIAKLIPGSPTIAALSYLPAAASYSVLAADGNIALVTPFDYFNFNATNLSLNGQLSLSGIGFQPLALASQNSAASWIAGHGAPAVAPLIQFGTGQGVALLEVGPLEPTISAVENGASFFKAPFAPGQLITIFGSQLGPSAGVGFQLSGGGIGTSAGGTTVVFDGIPAVILYASADQVNAVVPFEAPTSGTTQATVEYMGATSNSVTLPRQPSAPGIFTATGTGQGQGAVNNQDGSPNSAANPAPRGSVISIYATGGGQTIPSAIDGMLAPGPSKLALPVVVGIANRGVEVLYAGDAPGLIEGIIQINARIPDDAPIGPAVPLVIKVGDAYSQTVTIAVR